MSLAAKIKTIVNTYYPEAVFALSSNFEADFNSYFNDNSILIVLNNQLDVDDHIEQNVNFNSRERIQISVYIKDEFDTTDDASNTLAEQAKEISRQIYLKIWLLAEINAQASDARIIHKPFFKQFNSIRTGVLSLANWNVITAINCVKPPEIPD